MFTRTHASQQCRSLYRPMNTISRWSARVCRTRRNPIQHPHSVSLSRGRSDSHNPTHCISARMTAIACSRETNGYTPEFLSARKTTFHSSLLTRLRQTADTRRLPPGRATATVVCMPGRTTTKSVRLKDRDYDVTPYIIAHMCTKSVTGR